MKMNLVRKGGKNSIALLILCGMLVGGVSVVRAENAVSAEDAAGTENSERELIAIQKWGFKEPVKKQPVDPHPEHQKRNELREAKERRLDKDIAALTKTDAMADAPELLEEDDHIPVVLHYSDGTKDNYCFFKRDDEIYMKNKDGIIWADAEFIEDYTSFPEYPDVENDPNKRSGTTIHLPDPLALSMAKEMEQLDEQYYFVMEVSNRMKSGTSQEEAIEEARVKMLNDARMYEYALRHGFEIPEEKLKKEAEKWKDIVGGATNYEEMSKEYETAGMSLSEYHEKVYNVSNENFRMRNTIDWMHQAKQDAFWHGEDTVGDLVCGDSGEYWLHFVWDEILPEAETYDLSEYEKMLDEAEAYYLKMTAK